MNKNILIAAVGGLILLGGLVLVLQQGSQQGPQNPQEQAVSPTVEETGLTDQEKATDSAMQEGEVREVMIESTGLRFSLPEIKVKKGDTVKVTYKNNLATHDFTLDEFNVKTSLLNAGEEETVTFVADQAGTFEFYCSVPGHRQAGMKGAFIVE